MKLISMKSYFFSFRKGSAADVSGRIMPRGVLTSWEIACKHSQCHVYWSKNCFEDSFSGFTGFTSQFRRFYGVRSPETERVGVFQAWEPHPVEVSMARLSEPHTTIPKSSLLCPSSSKLRLKLTVCGRHRL